jgi:hypothetical protein
MRNDITEEQITELMRAIPRAEEVDRLRAENEKLRAALKGVDALIPDALLAERIARAQTGENHWRAANEQFRRSVALIWIEQVKTIRRAGLELVEREDGR